MTRARKNRINESFPKAASKQYRIKLRLAKPFPCERSLDLRISVFLTVICFDTTSFKISQKTNEARSFKSKCAVFLSNTN